MDKCRELIWRITSLVTNTILNTRPKWIQSLKWWNVGYPNILGISVRKARSSKKTSTFSASFCQNWNRARVSEKESVFPALNARGEKNKLAETTTPVLNSKTNLLPSIKKGSNWFQETKPTLYPTYISQEHREVHQKDEKLKTQMDNSDGMWCVFFPLMSQ